MLGIFLSKEEKAEIAYKRKVAQLQEALVVRTNKINELRNEQRAITKELEELTK